MEGFWVRLTPAQCAMHGLLGNHFPFWGPEPPLADRIRDGRAFLVRIAGVDLGFDPQSWHEHLRATDAGGYRWSNKHLGFPRQIAAALGNPEWQAAVESLRTAQDAEPNVAPDCGGMT
jgi:hypothetical protein